MAQVLSDRQRRLTVLCAEEQRLPKLLTINDALCEDVNIIIIVVIVVITSSNRLTVYSENCPWSSIKVTIV